MPLDFAASTPVKRATHIGSTPCAGKAVVEAATSRTTAGSRFGGAGLKLGVGGTLVALVAGYFLGIDPRVILGLTESLPAGGPAPTAQTGTPTG